MEQPRRHANETTGNYTPTFTFGEEPLLLLLP